MAQRGSTERDSLKNQRAGEFADDRVQHLIEELKKRTAELEEANRELHRVSHYRSLFLARLSHELRTPLTSILGFSEILLDQEQLSETQRRFCQKIQDSGLQLQTSLSQLVDISRLEAGQTELFLQEFPLRDALRESCAALVRSAQKKQVTLDYEQSPDITTIVSDQGKFRQVLYNFLGWAVSRSSAGTGVKLSATLAQPRLLQIVIDDEGKPVDLKQVFDPDAISSHEPDVADLGIIIGRRLLEVLEGTVDLSARAEGGVRTTIQIPARPAKG